MKDGCPLWKAPCKEHACKWYIQIQGLHPQTGEQLNRWDCAISWLPVLLIENSKKQHETGAAVESFRNEMVVANAQTRNALLDSSQWPSQYGPGLTPPRGGDGGG